MLVGAPQPFGIILTGQWYCLVPLWLCFDICALGTQLCGSCTPDQGS